MLIYETYGIANAYFPIILKHRAKQRIFLCIPPCFIWLL